MFELDEEEINKKCVKFFELQSNLIESCKELKDFAKKIREQQLKTMDGQNKKRKKSL
jgi:hypothetical protein